MRLSRLGRLARGATRSLWALAHQGHPVFVHVVTVGRCKRTCGYCSEYDGATKPVAQETLVERLQRLAELGTSAVLLTSREPLIHPEIDGLVAATRRLGMVAMLRIDGDGLPPETTERLNRAGLDHLRWDLGRAWPVGAAASSATEKAFQDLAGRARFGVTVAADGLSPDEAAALAARARRWGFECAAGPVEDPSPVLGPLRSRFPFRSDAPQGPRWSCRAGARYLYVDEDGIVHYCSLQRGRPGVPLSEYTREHMRREYATEKACAATCTLRDARQIARFDDWRSPQDPAPHAGAPALGTSSRAAR